MDAVEASPLPADAPGRWPHVELAAGVDLGLPTGARIEARLDRGAVRSAGVRAGGDLWVQDPNACGYVGCAPVGRVTPALSASVYVDVGVRGPWEVEPSFGATWGRWVTAPTLRATYGSFDGGLAVQYDPPSPVQVSAGVRLIAIEHVIPELGVALVW